MLTITDVAHALDELARRLGVPVIFKTMTMWHAHITSIKEDYYHHCNPFCMEAKNVPGSACNQEEEMAVLTRRNCPGGYFEKYCHAGALELVFPCRAGDELRGLLMAGPFRVPGRSCPRTGLAEAYRKLPLYRPMAMAPKLALLQVLAQGLAAVQPPVYKRKPMDERILTALAYMKEHVHLPLRAGDVAEQCNLSPSRFSLLFTVETGTPFARVLMRLKMEAARQLLAERTLQGAGIAQRLGFSDQSHFSSAFRKHTGMTPSQFQAWLKQNT